MRPRLFDEEKALHRAMELFWLNGYHQTSMDELVKTTGVHRASLYSLYHDKHGLLEAAIDRYLEHVIRPQTEALRTAEDGLAAIEAFFRDALAGLRKGKMPRVCLTIHCAVETITPDPAVMSRVRATALMIEDALESALRRAQLRGDVPAAHDAKALASLLRSHSEGLQLFARATPRHPSLAGLTTTLLDLIKKA